MGFFAFRLDSLHHTNIRSRHGDVDIVTFAVLINQVDRGHGAGIFPAWPGITNPTSPGGPPSGVAPDVRQGLMAQDWTIGPFELAPDDIVHVLYSGVNTSDASLSDQDAERLQLDILNRGIEAAAGAPGGLVGEIFTQSLGFFGDPAGTFLGWERSGPCNGVVFSDAVQFSGGGLDSLDYGETSFSLPHSKETRISKQNYTDEATHNRENCGGIAQTDVNFSIIKVLPPLSVTAWAHRRSPRMALRHGLLQLAPTNGPVRIKKLLNLVS